MSTVATAHAATDFETAWERAEQIKGWLTKAEAGLLFAAASRAPRGGCIVEIGSYRGKSTALLASTGREVVAIDPLYEGTGALDNYTIADDDAAALSSVVEQFPNARWIRGTASDFEGRNAESVSFLYIDGNHQPPHPLNDFRNIQTYLNPGAFIAWHDYGDRPAVGHAIRELEREGAIEKLQTVGTMWVGRYVNGPPIKKRRVFIGMPFSDTIQPLTWDSVLSAMGNQEWVEVHAWRSQWSLLNRSFNDCIYRCHKRGDADYFLLLHSDLGYQEPMWLETLVGIAEKNGFDALHAVSPIKNRDGLTSTAVAYSDDPWQRVRRITTKECKQLPETFDIETLKQCYDPNAKILLPNTGCLLLKYDEWFKAFPGFSSIDRILRLGEAEWEPGVVPEDWNFGFWAASKGLKVGATTAIKTNHRGAQIYSMQDAWGHEVDPEWAKEQVA